MVKIEKLLIASNNKGKIREIKTILKDVVKEFITPGEMEITEEVIEDGDTFTENAKKKAEFYFEKTGILTLSDDSGLEVDCINGLPGVKSSRYAGEHAADHKNNIKLLDSLKDIPENKRGAQFKCIMVLKGKDILEVTEGICRGKIAFDIRGDKGFGYDPVFIPYGYYKTFGELGAGIKDTISHRRKALEEMKKVFRKFS